MTENEAYSKGYVFTGIYVREKEDAKRQAAELRLKGFRACVVVSPRRRHRSDGYSVFSKEAKNTIRKNVCNLT